MAQISFRILGNPASSGGYTPLISKGEPLEADKVEIPYPNYTTDGECYGIKIYPDVVSYALYTNPIKVTSFDGNRSAALNIYLYIPKGYIVTFDGQEVSPKRILDRLSEEFYTQFMTKKGGATSATWNYKTQAIEDFSESKSLFVNIINDYILQEKKQRSLVMSGHTNANVIVGSNNNIALLMLDPYYEQLSSYDRLIIIENGESNNDTVSLAIPRPKTYEVYVNSCYFCQIKSDTQAITTNYQPMYSYKIAENYSFTLQDVKKGMFAERVKIDDINETVNCSVPEKDKVTEWIVIINVDGKPAEPAFKEQLYRTMYRENSGTTKRIESDKIKLIGAEIEKKWVFKGIKQEGYEVAISNDNLKRETILSYTKKDVIPKTPVQIKPTQGGGSTISKIQKNESSTIKFSLNDKDNEYSESDFSGTKLTVKSENHDIIISFYLKSNVKKGIHIFEDDVEVEHYIADKIFNNRIHVKSKNFTFECNIDRKGREIRLTPEELPFFKRLRKKWWFKMLIILLLCVISGGIGFYVNNILLQNKRESIGISDFNVQSKGYILNGKVYKDDDTSLGYILESNIYRTQNTDDEIVGVYNHEYKVLTLGNPKTKISQDVIQPGTSVQPTVPGTAQPNVTNPSQPEQLSPEQSKKLQTESTAWMSKIKDGTITFDEIEQCRQWANENSTAPQVSIIKTCCDKISKVKDFILSIQLNTQYKVVKNNASALNNECFQEQYKDYLRPYRVILQKFIPTTNVTKESIDNLIYNIGLINENQGISSFNQINNPK